MERFDESQRCPNTGEIVGMYTQGWSIKSMTKIVYASRIFVDKAKAREHVEKTIYDYLLLQKKTGFGK